MLQKTKVKGNTKTIDSYSYKVFLHDKGIESYQKKYLA